MCLFARKKIKALEEKCEMYKSKYEDSQKLLGHTTRVIINAISPDDGVFPVGKFKVVTLDSISEIPDTEKCKSDATIFFGDESYMYLSKGFREEYTHACIGINSANGKCVFILNSEGVGLPIDSNNRLKCKMLMEYIRAVYGGISPKYMMNFITKIANSTEK